MGLFDSKRRQLDDLEREVLANPTPQNMVSLVERYMAAGNEEKALEVARKAVEKFPDSEKCQTTYANVRRLQLQAEITELNRVIRKSPSRSHYERLADIYHRELGNRTKAFETALEGLAKFPSSDGLHMISGQIRMDRFHQDFLANDFVEAVRHFEKAASANPRNYKTLVSLARLYTEVGAYYKAKPVLEQVLRASPGDEHAEQLLRFVTGNISKASASVDDALAEIETRRALSAEGLEACQIFEPPNKGAAAPQVNPSQLDAFLVGFESMSGYKCSAVLTRDGSVVASHTRGMVAKDRFSRFLQDIYQVSEDASRKMDIGTFVSGELETSIGRVATAEWKGFLMGILADHPAKKEDLDHAVEKFVSFISVG
jgi:tetratricopeptide (TPR) repeat protein/predicted regulator of Ras-like GTPase activity (Roadblock/LC7/MglB family)